MAIMRTRLTDLLEIEHPVMLAGMGGVSYYELVAAVSEAGGFGCMGASTMNLDRMVQQMQSVGNDTRRANPLPKTGERFLRPGGERLR